MKKFYYLMTFALFGLINVNAQNIFEFKFSKLEYFAPASMNSPQKKEIFSNPSVIILDIDNQLISITTLFSDNEIVKNNYKIKSMIDLSGLHKFICIASNYSEVVIEINTQSYWIRRTIKHNNITHKYYN